MKLSIAQIAVLLDTIAGSLAIADGGRIFRYTTETRQALLESLTTQAAQQSVQLTAAGVESDGKNQDSGGQLTPVRSASPRRKTCQ